jgi:hypothetical protein
MCELFQIFLWILLVHDMCMKCLRAQDTFPEKKQLGCIMSVGMIMGRVDQKLNPLRNRIEWKIVPTTVGEISHPHSLIAHQVCNKWVKNKRIGFG